MSDGAYWSVDDPLIPNEVNEEDFNVEPESDVQMGQGAPGCILYDPHKNEYKALHPFTTIQKKIEDEFIDMSFLNNFLAIPLTEDGGVIKYCDPNPPANPPAPKPETEKKEEDSEDYDKEPEPLARVRIRYESRKESGELLDKQRDRKQLKAFRLHGEDMIAGIHHATASLKRGESAWFKFLPDYHYGPQGAPPLVPENAVLYYKVELTDFTNPKKPLANDNYEGRIEILVDCREKGNAAFANKEYDRAFKEYKRGTETIKNLPKVLAAVLNEEQKATLKDFQIKLANNALLACLKRESYKEGLTFADVVLKADSKNSKALFRKGQCLMALEYFDHALKDFVECIKLDAESRNDCEKMIAECKKRKERRLKNEKKRFCNIFERMTEQEEKEEAERKLKEKMERRMAREKNMARGNGDEGGEAMKKVKTESKNENSMSVNPLGDVTDQVNLPTVNM